MNIREECVNGVLEEEEKMDALKYLRGTEAGVI